MARAAVVRKSIGIGHAVGRRSAAPYLSPVQEVYTLADLRNRSSRAADDPPIRLGVFGSPVAHSRSPEMQNAALQRCGLHMRYARFEIAPAELETALRLLPSLGYVGVNLTIPHKIAATGLVDELDGFARKVGAINTVRVDGEKLLGFNTDGPGFARAIQSEFAVSVRDLRVLVLGAGGGAGRAIAMQCASDGCKQLVLVNRTHALAAQLASELQQTFAGAVSRFQAVPWSDPALRAALAEADLIVNATPVGMKVSDPPILTASWIDPRLIVYDTIYNPARTRLLLAAEEAGARATNGLSMLLHQGALAFEHWFHRQAPTQTMRSALATESQ